MILGRVFNKNEKKKTRTKNVLKHLACVGVAPPPLFIKLHGTYYFSVSVQMKISDSVNPSQSLIPHP